MINKIILVSKKLFGMLGDNVRRAWQAGVMHLGFSNFLTRLTALAQRILLARILGAENIGHIAVISTTLNIIRLPAGAGTFTVVNKLVAENTGDINGQKGVVGTSLLINSITSLTVCIVSWVILTQTNWVNDQVANRLLRTLIFLLPIMIFTEVMRNALMGQRRIKNVAGIGIGLSFLSIVVVVPMAYFWSLNGWTANLILVTMIGIAIMAWNLRDILSLNWNNLVAKKVATIGTFAFLGQLVGTLIVQFDTLSVSGILKDAALTGIYNTASLVASQMLVIPGTVLNIVFPFVAQNRDNLPLLKKRYWELYKKLGLMAIGMAALATVISPWFFPVFGGAFSASVAPFRILVLGFIARTIYVLDNTYLDALGRTDIHFVTTLIVTGITIFLNITLIQNWGLIGAAWATTIGSIVNLIIHQIVVHYFIFFKGAIR